MREYVTAILVYQADTGSLPPDLEMLAEKKIIRELKLVENHATGKKEKPLYYGGPKLRVEDFDASQCMVLAAPSPDREGKRLVAFLDGSVKMIDEEDYQAQLEWQRKPLMERTIDAFLESCAREGIADYKQLFGELGMAGFIAQYGKGEHAMREHHDKLPLVMRLAIAEETGEPDPAFITYVRGVYRGEDPRLAKQAGLLLGMLGIEPDH